RSKQTGLVNAYFHYSAGWICDWKGPLLCRLMTEAGLCLLDTQSISGGVSVIRGLAASLPLSVQKLVPVPIPVPAKDFAKAHTVARGASLDKAHAWTGCPVRLVHSNDKDLRWNLADGFVPGVGMRHAGVGTPLTLVQNGRDLYLAYSVVNRPNAAALLEVLRGTSQLRSEDWILILLQLLVILVEEDQPASVVSLRQTLREKTEVMEGIQSGTDNPKLRCLLEAIGKELSGELEQGPLAFLADRERCETWGIDGLLYDAGC
ncbi:MAG: hypothetical protein KDK78_09775, partial [Chlamydiia bacterium]|nr:hypothetical protein [Chlamydiia bacterium]